MRKRTTLPVRVTHIPVKLLSDARIKKCSASTAGVFVSILCAMTASERYGQLDLSDRDNVVRSLSVKLQPLTGYDESTIERALHELLAVGALTCEGDILTSQELVHIAEVSQKRSQVGKAGGEITKQRLFSTQYEPVQSVSTVAVIERPPEQINEPVTKEKRFIKPTVEIVAEYCKSKGYTDVDPEAFVAYYESNGWMVGKTHMKKWTAAITTWRKNHKKYNGNYNQSQKQSDAAVRIAGYAERIARIDANNKRK